MRVTGARIVDLAASSTSKNQSSVATLTEEVTSGLRVSKPSDDPAAWLQAQRQKIRSALNDGSSSALSTGLEQLQQSDGALSSISQLVSQARELAIEGSNDTQNATSRAAIGAEMNSIFNSMIAFANTKNSAGEYIFAGSQSATQPFDTTTGAYVGDAAVRTLNTDTVTSTIASVPGTKLTAANGVDVIPLMKQLANALNANDGVTTRSLLGDLDTAVKQLAQTRGETGGYMNVITSTKTAHDELSTRLATSISNLTEVDETVAASNLAKASTALTVSQTVTSHVLSILDPSKQ
ncbi:MAG: flagellar hook-associated protein FlgL [Kofleriaceae bacterium]